MRFCTAMSIVFISLFMVGCEQKSHPERCESSNNAVVDRNCNCEVKPSLSLHELSRVFCEIGTNGIPLGSGFLMSREINGQRMYYVVSADHVFRSVHGPDKSLWFAFQGTNEEHCADIDIPQNINWFHTLVQADDGSDITAFDITSAAKELARYGVAFIDFTPSKNNKVGEFCLSGVRMLQSSELAKNGISIETTAYSLVNSPELWNLAEDKLASSMVLRESCISKMPNIRIKSPVSKNSAKYFRFILLDSISTNGQSGGVVIAQNNCSEWNVIGIISARMPPVIENELTSMLPSVGTFVTPFDGLETSFLKINLGMSKMISL